MRRIILACALAGVLAVPAKADETLKFRVVDYVASAHTQQVGDVNGHTQGFIRYPGVASFLDGSTAKTLVFATFDGVDGPGGGGTSGGYGNMRFRDGSELWWKWTGTYKIDSAQDLSAGGTLNVTSGKGRYAGAKGDGTWEAIQDRPAETGGEILGVVDFVLNIKK
jgi:hypothetical protein